MMSRSLAALGAALAMAGCMPEGRTASADRQGGSTATITQADGASHKVTRVTSGPNGQTIVRRQGGSTAVVRQGGGADPDRTGAIDLQTSASFRGRFLDRMSPR